MKTIPLRIAAILALLTGLAHTAGTFMPIPAEQKAVLNAFNVMQSTLVPMPMGVPHSYADIFLGTNLIVSLLLLLACVVFWALAGADRRLPIVRFFLIIHGMAMVATAVVSAFFFFPLPAVFTGVAGIIALYQAKN